MYRFTMDFSNQIMLIAFGWIGKHEKSSVLTWDFLDDFTSHRCAYSSTLNIGNFLIHLEYIMISFDFKKLAAVIIKP